MNKLPLLLLLLFCGQLNAQFISGHCGQPDLSRYYALNNEEVIHQRNEIEKFTQEWIKTYQENQVQQREAITIPIVVHVVWNRTEENISDLQIESQIDATNADFRKLNANLNLLPEEFLNQAVDVEIEFCLANIDPFGNATNGITRTQTDFENVGTLSSPGNRLRVFDDDLGGKTGWPTDEYLNIWVAETGGFPLGFACLPGTCPIEEDGVVIDGSFFGTTCNTISPFNLGRTLTHELGHFLNLSHIWGDGFDNATCEGDDFVDDTPLQDGPSFGCPIHPVNSCGSNNQFFNYMDFSDDECLAMFTEGQKLRMLATLNGPRSGLLTSNGCGLISTSPISLNENSVLIFPNPVIECLHIDVDLENQTPILMTVFNATGQLVFSSENTPNDLRSIDVTSLLPGVYFVNIELGTQSVTKRFVVQ